jgi:hypothetical protein
MAKKLTKGKAFWASFWALLACYGITAWIAKDALPTVGPFIVGAIAAAGGIFQAANVADNALKGKFYQPDLDKESK